MKNRFTLLLLMIAVSASSFVNAQPFTVFASGFSNLIGISRDVNGNLWVAESGSGNNDSRISMITPSAAVYPVITGLPSFLDSMSGEVSGAWRAEVLPSNELMVVVGGGPDSLAGSLMFFNISGFVPGTSSPYTTADADSVLHVLSFVFSQGFTDSDPYSAAFDNNGNIYIADAGANAVVKYEVGTQTFSILDTFPDFPNPFGGNPPSFDYVPTRIISNPAGGFLMGNLGSFFPGLGRIISIDNNGNNFVIDTGFTSLVDIQLDSMTGDRYALEFGEFDSLFNPIPGSAKISRIDAGGNRTMLYTGFGPSPGLVLDGAGGAYVTEIVSGNVLYFSDISSIQNVPVKSALSIAASPNPFTSSIDIVIHPDVNTKAEMTIKNMIGETVFSSSLQLDKGENHFSWNGSSSSGLDLPGGNYFVTVKAAGKISSLKILKQ